jgi:hypothetical protein
VSKYAQRWDYYPAEGGKIVWAELRLPSPPLCREVFGGSMVGFSSDLGRALHMAQAEPARKDDFYRLGDQ